MAVSNQAPSEAQWQTHAVANQAPPLEDVDVFASNLPLVEATRREGAEWIAERASKLGKIVGAVGGPQDLWGRLANENKPVLRTHDRYGNRTDEVEFLPPLDWTGYGQDAAADPAIVAGCYDDITGRMQVALDRLAAERPYPVLDGYSQLTTRAAADVVRRAGDLGRALSRAGHLVIP